ncbi:MAG TPA: biotin synthase BioB [Candidatus Alistipes merdigallinarum]|nr:biotin synthase BioB [Candidatus Alistipes merdigallinarum]
MESISGLEKKIEEGYRPDYDEALSLMRSLSLEDLCALAHALRLRYQGKRVDMCSIMNARSGKCGEDCKWCSQSRFHHTDIEVYPLVGADEALHEAIHNASKGVSRFSLVTSGRTLSPADTERICAIYRRIGSECSIKLCASLGLLNREQLFQLKESGVTRYHCNLETAPSYFPQLCTTHTIEEKFQTIEWAREAGLEVCSGGIIGMGESEEQRVEFALAIRRTGAVSIPVNILNPIPGTRLAGTPPLKDDEVVRAVAMIRILNPEASVRLAGGRSRIKAIEPELFRCGISGSIVGDLLTTTGSDIDTDKAMFLRLGFEL